VPDDPSPDSISPAADTAAAPRIVSSESLLAGQRELLIQHGTEQYRLRLTANNKLILVK
jgi:hemin uptake protein HemP